MLMLCHYSEQHVITTIERTIVSPGETGVRFVYETVMVLKIHVQPRKL